MTMLALMLLETIIFPEQTAYKSRHPHQQEATSGHREILSSATGEYAPTPQAKQGKQEEETYLRQQGPKQKQERPRWQRRKTSWSRKICVCSFLLCVDQPFELWERSGVDWTVRVERQSVEAPRFCFVPTIGSCCGATCLSVDRNFAVSNAYASRQIPLRFISKCQIGRSVSISIGLSPLKIPRLPRFLVSHLSQETQILTRNFHIPLYLCSIACCVMSLYVTTSTR